MYMVILPTFHDIQIDLLKTEQGGGPNKFSGFEKCSIWKKVYYNKGFEVRRSFV